jgi:hypothetical protein
MQRKQSGSVRVSYRREAEEDISAKDLTRRQLLSYLFEDFFRISYDVLSLFFDALIIPELYLLRPAAGAYGLLPGDSFAQPFYGYYLLGVVVVLEIVAIWLEIKCYRYLWPKYKVIRVKKKSSSR